MKRIHSGTWLAIMVAAVLLLFDVPLSVGEEGSRPEAPTGTNVPDYPKLCQLWWQNVGEAVSGEVTVDRAMDNLAREQDKVMARIERAGAQKECGPKLNPCIDPNVWLNKPGSPKAKVNEKPKGQTVDYDKLIQAWREGRVK